MLHHRFCRYGVSLLVVLWLTHGVGSALAQEAGTVADRRFLSVAWVQNSAEYQLLTRQSYRLAQYQLNIALGDAHWTADEFQLAAGNYTGKPPAVILDIDETVLDNSAYNARNIADGLEYSLESWNQWCEEEKAVPIPGAIDFLNAAEALGVTVFFVTNRREEVQTATINNLKKFGINASEQNVLCRNDAAGWGGDKISRRARVAEDYRILLLIGDNLSDICSEVEIADNKQRNETANRKADFLGTRWIVLPNPVYGSWEQSLPKKLGNALRLERSDVTQDPPLTIK